MQKLVFQVAVGLRVETRKVALGEKPASDTGLLQPGRMCVSIYICLIHFLIIFVLRASQ